MKKTITSFAVVLLLALCLVAGVACSKVRNKILAPDTIEYDGQYITWNKVELADHYLVRINGGEKTRSNSTTYAYASSEAFEVVVYSVLNGTESASDAITFRPLQTIETISVSEKGELSWTAVSGANAYLISINGQTATIADTAYTELKG